jgi:hypothetical protein
MQCKLWYRQAPTYIECPPERGRDWFLGEVYLVLDRECGQSTGRDLLIHLGTILGSQTSIYCTRKSGNPNSEFPVLYGHTYTYSTATSSRDHPLRIKQRMR